MCGTMWLQVPVEMQCSLFFSETETVVQVQEVQGWKEFDTCITFPYDISFFCGVEAYKPWEHVHEHIPHLLEKWKEVEESCRIYFIERQAKRALEPMREGIALFFMMLFWIHDKPVLLQDWPLHVDKLNIKPMNTVERLTFIMQGPARYHAFIQLSELFRELEKHYVKNQIKNRLRQ